MGEIADYVLHHECEFEKQNDYITFSGASKENESQSLPRTKKSIKIHPLENLKEHRQPNNLINQLLGHIYHITHQSGQFKYLLNCNNNGQNNKIFRKQVLPRMQIR